MRGRADAKLIEFVASPIARVGAILSLLSRKNGIGKPEKTELDESVGRRLREYLGGAEEKHLFATNDNNFGLLQLSRIAERTYARFELRSLSTLDYTGNRWGGPSRCLTDLIPLYNHRP